SSRTSRTPHTSPYYPRCLRPVDVTISIGYRGGDNCAEEMGEENQVQEKEALLARPVLRQKFAAVGDIVLLKAVNTFRPWTAAVGTSKGIMKDFDDINRLDKRSLEQQCALALQISLLSTGQTSVNRCGNQGQWRIALMNDWEDKEAQRKEDQTAKQHRIECSGELLRSLAMGEIASEEAEVQAGFNDGSQREDSASESVEASMSSCTVARGLLDRLQVPIAVARAKLPKESGLIEDEKSKFQYKMQRLQFEREQEDKKRLHASEKAEKRRAHELLLKDRRRQADEDRDKRMQEYILKVLKQQKQ
ncbi:hypothetical protein GN958_ATG22178, partial [Phytophthora infestans]